MRYGMKMNKDVTSLVDFGFSDEESLPLLKCVCGEKFDYWEHQLGVYEDNPTECTKCGIKLYFEFAVKVYQVEGDIDERE